MKEKQILKCPKRLIHLSEENHDDEWFKPCVPCSIVQSYDAEYNEDNITKRICFSSSITGAFYGISFDGKYKKLYVHIPENLEKIVKRGKLYKPSEEQVFDADYTNEYWIKCNVKMKCIGIIYIGYRITYYSNRPTVKFRWLRKF